MTSPHERVIARQSKPPRHDQYVRLGINFEVDDEKGTLCEIGLMWSSYSDSLFISCHRHVDGQEEIRQAMTNGYSDGRLALEDLLRVFQTWSIPAPTQEMYDYWEDFATQFLHYVVRGDKAENRMYMVK